MWPVFYRELAGFVARPTAWLFVLAFLVVTPTVTFQFGGFFAANKASLETFFFFHPWVYLFLLPVLSMGLWAEEYKTRTIEFLLASPVSIAELVVAKFLAVWLLAGFSLVLTMPMVVLVNFLGSPDNGAIVSGYMASFFMAGGLLAMGVFFSACTRAQITAFITTAIVGFLLIIGGYDFFLQILGVLLPADLLEAMGFLTLLPAFEQMVSGLVSLSSLAAFAIFILFWLCATTVVVNAKRAS